MISYVLFYVAAHIDAWLRVGVCRAGADPGLDFLIPLFLTFTLDAVGSRVFVRFFGCADVARLTRCLSSRTPNAGTLQWYNSKKKQFYKLHSYIHQHHDASSGRVGYGGGKGGLESAKEKQRMNNKITI